MNESETDAIPTALDSQLKLAQLGKVCVNPAVGLRFDKRVSPDVFIRAVSFCPSWMIVDTKIL